MVRNGASRADAAAALAALRRLFDARALRIGQSIDLDFGPARDGKPRPLDAVALSPEPGRRVMATRVAGGFASSSKRLPATQDFGHAAGAIKTSLFESATEQGVPPQVLAEMIRAFSYDVDFQRDLQPGDEFEVMYERTIDGQGDVLKNGAIVYAELVLSGRRLPLYRFVDSTGFADFYNSKGESVRKALLRTPVDGARITSGYGMRLHPILGYTTMHKGVDFGAPVGTKIMAAGDGVVVDAGYRGNYGLYLRVRHSLQYSTAYAHMSRLAPGIHVGNRVRQGETIGYVGATGLATGPHLYYEVLVNDRQVNPMGVRFKSGNALGGRELARFDEHVAEIEMRLAGTPVQTQVALERAAK